MGAAVLLLQVLPHVDVELLLCHNGVGSLLKVFLQRCACGSGDVLLCR